MALSGLEIYKRPPKTNCKECGFPTCLAFAMQLAAKKASLDKCPKVTEAARQALESASQPPIRLITIGAGDTKFQAGNETVLFRHEQAFYNPTGIGIIVDDSAPETEFESKIKAVDKLRFERVGQKIQINFIAVRDAGGDPAKFANAVKKASELSGLNLVLMSRNPSVLKQGLETVKARRPLVWSATKDNFNEMAGIAKEYGVPLAVSAEGLAALSELSVKVGGLGAQDLILEPASKGLSQKVRDFTQIRRLALRKNYRPFGFPTMAIIDNPDQHAAALEAASLVAKYAGIVLVQFDLSWQILPILTVRQNIYTDPQKPLQVEPKIYTIGAATDKSPVIVTTNFSLTYYTVETEVEASKVPAYIVSVDAEGMSVLTAWAAEKFTPEKIAKALNTGGIKQMVTHTNVIIPGYVAIMSGKLEEDSGWKVMVGPREASGLPAFLKNL